MADTKFVTLIRGCNNPKLSWLLAQLELVGVKARVGPMSFNGPVIEVEEGHAVKALEIIYMPVGMLNTSGALQDENITPMDLMDNHPLFRSGVDIEDIPREPIVPVMSVVEDDPDPLADIPTIEEAEAEQDIVAVVVPAEEEDDLDWLNEPIEAPSQEEIVESIAQNEDDPFADETDPASQVVEEVEPTHPELDYLKAKELLEFDDVMWTGVKTPVTMYQVDSSNLNDLGAIIKQTDQNFCTLYVRFKGGENPYRYGPVKMTVWNELLGEAVRKAEGNQNTSIGSLFHHLVKLDAEAGTIKCQMLQASGTWTEVEPRKARVQRIKEKHTKE